MEQIKKNPIQNLLLIKETKTIDTIKSVLI